MDVTGREWGSVGAMAAFVSLPWYAVLTLPALFAAGMSLLDTIDGCLMNFAYGWAFAKPAARSTTPSPSPSPACPSPSRW